MGSFLVQAGDGRQQPTADLQQLLSCPGHPPVYGNSGRVLLTNGMSGHAWVDSAGRDSSSQDSVRQSSVRTIMCP